jgi:hypothetical protein
MAGTSAQLVMAPGGDADGDAYFFGTVSGGPGGRITVTVQESSDHSTWTSSPVRVGPDLGRRWFRLKRA